jgi:hypothetical protein
MQDEMGAQFAARANRDSQLRRRECCDNKNGSMRAV